MLVVPSCVVVVVEDGESTLAGALTSSCQGGSVPGCDKVAADVDVV